MSKIFPVDVKVSRLGGNTANNKNYFTGKHSFNLEIKKNSFYSL